MDNLATYRKRVWIDVSLQPGEHGREDCQAGWQEWVGASFENLSILDVGAGLGLSRARLGINGNRVTLQDLQPSLPVDLFCPINELPSKSCDVVTAFDVIEHVKRDVAFLADLVRLARECVFITTPNRDISKCRNPYHFREYTPRRFLHRVRVYKNFQLLVGSSDGKVMQDIAANRFIWHEEPHQAALICPSEADAHKVIYPLDR